MAKPTPTQEQQAVIHTLDKPLFVAAGAGSGKTATLVNRIMYALSTDSGPYLKDISQILVITFTEKAANELKDRVRQALREQGYNNQALRMDEAWISTIHGMCIRILRECALQCNLDPNFSVLSEVDEKELVNTLLLQNIHAAQSENIKKLYYANQSACLSAAHTLFNLYAEYGEDLCGVVVQRSASLADIKNHLQLALEAHREVLASGKASEKAQPYQEILEKLISYHDFDTHALCECLKDLCVLGIPRDNSKKPEFYDHFSYVCANTIQLFLQPVFDEMCALAKNTYLQYNEIKLQKSALTFQDILYTTRDLLRNYPDVADRYANQFKLVMIDEFQDTNDLQVEIIKRLSGENMEHLATVGDEKQSIYSFQGADVEVFQNHGESLEAQSRCSLSKNFRSHNEILRFVQAVCDADIACDSNETSDIDEKIVKNFFDLDAANPKAYESSGSSRIMLTACDGGVTADRGMVLAQNIAQKFDELRSAGYRAKDMAVLLRNMNHAHMYVDALRAHGFSCVVSGGKTSFAQTQEVQLLQHLVTALANPRQTEDLFAVCASEMFALDADDFIEVATQRDAEVLNKTQISQGIFCPEHALGKHTSRRLKAAQRVLHVAFSCVGKDSVRDICMYVCKESGWLYRLEQEGVSGKTKLANILHALDLLEDLEKDCSGAREVSEKFAQLLLDSKEASIVLHDEQDSDAVQIMTIHKSKGLEFPVVAVADSFASPKKPSDFVVHKNSDGTQYLAFCCTKDFEKKLFSDLATGYLPQEVCDKLFKIAKEKYTYEKRSALQAQKLTPELDAPSAYIALQQALQTQDKEESARLLYVAMTRAQEHLMLAIDAKCEKSTTQIAQAKNGVNALGHRVLFALGLYDLKDPGRYALSYTSKEQTYPLDYTHISIQADSDDKNAEKLVVTDKNNQGIALSDFCAVHQDNVDTKDFVVYDELCGTTRLEPAMDETDKPASYSKISEMHEHYFTDTSNKKTQAQELATSFGSSFHELAQIMCETQQDMPSDEQIERVLARNLRGCNVSAKEREALHKRLVDALVRWSSSELYAQTKTYDQRYAEAPFFVDITQFPELEPYTEHAPWLVGFVDLLCYKQESDGITVHIVDYKTGDKNTSQEELRAHHRLQADIYAYVILKLRKDVTKLCFSFAFVERESEDDTLVCETFKYNQQHKFDFSYLAS